MTHTFRTTYLLYDVPREAVGLDRPYRAHRLPLKYN